MTFFKPQPKRLPIEFKIPKILTPRTAAERDRLIFAMRWHKQHADASSDKRDRYRYNAIIAEIHAELGSLNG